MSNASPRTRHQTPGPGTKTRVVFVNRYFHPDHSATSLLLGDLAIALARSDRFDVSVVASRQRYEQHAAALPRHDGVAGVTIRRVGGTRFGRGRLWGRAIDYLSFHVASAWAALRLLRPGDIVVSKTDPPLLSISIGLVARLRGARRVNWLQDLFPEVAAQLRMLPLPAPLLAALTSLRDRSLMNADANVVIGDLMAKRLLACSVAPDRVRTIPNWIDSGWFRPVTPEANSKRRAWDLAGCFVVQYSGNLGRVHEVETLLSAIRTLAREQPSIRFLFVGGGVQRARLERTVSESGLANVSFRPYQPRSELAETLSVADVHLVTLLPALEGMVVPSKFYGICAVGRATLYIGDPEGELGRIVAGERLGLVVRDGDADGLVSAIRQLAADRGACAAFGANARAAAETRWDKRIAVAQFMELLDGLDRRAPAGAHATT